MFVGNIGGKFVAFLMLPVYTTWLSVEEYGMTDIIQTYVLFGMSIITLSIFEAIFVFPKDVNESEKTEYYTTGFFFNLFCYVSLFIIAFFLFPHIGGLVTEYRYGIIAYCILMSLQSYLQQFCRCQNKMEVYGISGLIVSVLVLVFSLFLVQKYKIWGFLISLILANFFGCLYIFIHARQYQYFHLGSFCSDKLGKMLAYSIPLIPNSIIWWCLQSLNRPMMEHYCGLTSVGLYAVANKIPVIMVFATGIFNNAWNVSALDEGKAEDFEQYYNKMIRAMIVLTAIAAIVICMLTPLLIQILAGDSYSDSVGISFILTIASLSGAYAGFIASVFIINKKSQYFLYSGICGCIICVALYMITIPVWGAVGAASAVLISQVIIFYTRVYYAKKLISIDFLATSSVCILIGVVYSIVIFSQSWSVVVGCGIVSLMLIVLTNKNTVSEIYSKINENAKRKFRKL